MLPPALPGSAADLGPAVATCGGGASGPCVGIDAVGAAPVLCGGEQAVANGMSKQSATASLSAEVRLTGSLSRQPWV